MAGIKGTPFMNYVGYVYEQGLKVIPNKKYYRNLAINEESINEYMDLQYDLLFGQKYLNNNIALEDKDIYCLGLEEFMITDLAKKDKETKESKESDDEETTLEVKGKGFTKNSIVYIHDEPTDTKLINSGCLSVTVPNELFNADSVLEIQVKIIDSLDKVLVESKKTFFNQK
jgi:hypothetical protein